MPIIATHRYTLKSRLRVYTPRASGRHPDVVVDFVGHAIEATYGVYNDWNWEDGVRFAVYRFISAPQEDRRHPYWRELERAHKR